MSKYSVCNLISETHSKDQHGVFQKVEKSRQVFCEIASVSRDEVFEGGRNGLNPDKKITVYSFEYENENIVELDGVRYTVYRTYEAKNDRIELYVEVRKGNE